MTQEEQRKRQAEITLQKLEITKTLLIADRKRAADVLLLLRYQLSKTTSSITILPESTPDDN